MSNKILGMFLGAATASAWWSIGTGVWNKNGIFLAAVLSIACAAVIFFDTISYHE